MALTFDREEVERLGVSIVDDRIQEIAHNKGQLKLSGRQRWSSVSAGCALRPTCLSSALSDTGAVRLPQLTEAGHIEVDGFQRTDVPGIYAVGDSADPFRAVSMATAAGTRAGSFINHEFIQEK